mgnify:CR=1 FL=1
MNNNNIKKIQSLNSKKGRLKNNLFLIEGRRLVESALLNHSKIRSIYFTEKFQKNNTLIIKKIKKLKIINKKISNQNLKKITFTDNPSGIIGLVLLEKETELNHNKNKWIYLDEISDPGNLGTIFRSASWFNFKNIALSENCVDPYNPKTVRASMGSIFNLSIYTKIQLNQFSKNYRKIGCSMKGINVNNYIIPKKFVLIIGNEAKGITKKNLIEIDQMITIKKLGIGDSLNVASAASIIMHKVSD